MLASRLKSEREKLGMNKKEVSEQLGIPYTTYCNYEAGSREPNSEMLKKIANYYSVTLDYLLGLSDLADSSLQQETSERFLNSGDRIRQLREQLGLTQDEVANIVGVSKSTVSKWESGHIENMKRDKISLLAKALNVSPLYIMGLDDSLSEPDPSTEEKNEMSDLDAFLNMQKLDDTIRQNAENTYIIHGSQGKGSVVKAISKDKCILAGNGNTYDLTQAEFTALESVIKAMRLEKKN